MTTISVTERTRAALAKTSDKVSKPPLDESVGEVGGSASNYVKGLLAHTAHEPYTKLTPRIIGKMRHHHQVASCLVVQSMPSVRADWTIECDDPDIAEQLTLAYRQISHDVQRMSTKALWAGYSPATLMWTYDEHLGMIVVDEVRDLDPHTCKPIVDADGQYAGFKQRQSDGSEPPFELAQTLWITEGMESGNLFGRSLLRNALDDWQDYEAFRAFHARMLERFGEPVVKTRAPSGQTIVNAAEILAATNAGETAPAPVFVDNLQRAKEVGENLRHHSVLALPGDLAYGGDGKPMGFQWDVSYLEAAGNNGDALVAGLEMKSRNIARGMFVPDLLITNSDTGAFALGNSHRSVFEDQSEGRLDDWGRQQSTQIIDRMRILNFGANSPKAQLTYAPMSDEDRDKHWEIAKHLIENGTLIVDVVAEADRLGIPMVEQESIDVTDQATKVAASPFSSVGIPALIAANVISAQEGRDLLGIEGDAPEPPPPPAPPVAPAGDGTAAPTDEQLRAHAAEIRADLGLSGPAPCEVLAAVTRFRGFSDNTPGDHLDRPDRLVASGNSEGRWVDVFAANVDGLPEWKLPQSWDPPAGFRRELTDREKRVGFAKIEAGMNRVEAQSMQTLVDLLEAERDRVLRQLAGILKKGSAAEIIEALGTIELKGQTSVVAAWRGLMGEVADIAIEQMQTELAAFAAQLPTTAGPELNATFKTFAKVNGERIMSGITTDVQSTLVNAYTSGVQSRAGLASLVGDVFEGYETAEGKPVRLTTRMLSAKSLNLSRASVMERSGVPLKGAQYSALLDKRTCDMCERQDEMVIPIEHTDLARFTPPVHHNCRCLWVWITADEEDFTPTWSSPAPSMVDRFGSLVF